jgi:choline dehydrogenase/4-pyridoxate dehydrogenase
MMRLDRAIMEFGKAYLFGCGMATSMPSAGVAFVRSKPGLPAPDLQIVTAATPHDAYPYLPPFKAAYRDLLVTRVILLRPESRGEIRLRSANPTDKVRIYQNMLTCDSDWDVLGNGVRLLRELGQQPSLRDIISKEVGSIPVSNQDPDMRNFLRETANSISAVRDIAGFNVKCFVAGLAVKSQDQAQKLGADFWVASPRELIVALDLMGQKAN